MPKKEVKVKKTNGDINITIENNLKANQNTEQTVRRRRRKRTDLASGGGTLQDILRGGGTSGKLGGAPPPQRPYVDVSYIRPPPQSYSIWNDTTVPNPDNVGVGYTQAQQFGLINTQTKEGVRSQAPESKSSKTNPLVNYPVDEIDDSQKSRYVEPEIEQEIEEDYETRYKTPLKSTRNLQNLYDSQESRYVDRNDYEEIEDKDPLSKFSLEPNEEELNNFYDDEEETDSSKIDALMEKDLNETFGKKRGRPTNKEKEEREKAKEMKADFYKMLIEPRSPFKLSDEEIAKLADQEFYNEGVKMAREGLEIPKDEIANAPTPFLKGYRSVLPSSPAKKGRDDDDVSFGPRLQQGPLRRPGRPQRNRKPVEKFKP
jgi:hypothetical protein